MRKSNREVNGEKVFRYSIRKYHFGAASVAVAALMFFANGAVKADPLVSPVTANTEKVNAGVTNLTEGVPLEKSLEAEGNKEIVAPESAEETSNKKDGAGSSAQGAKEIKVSDKAVIPANQTEEINKAETNGKEKEVVTNKDKLESLLTEIDQLNLKDYTEDSVKVLQEKVAKAKEVLVNATTQKEIDLAYNALVGYKNAGLKRVPKPKGELTPKPDTTNGKATVGIKAENTEPNGTNIAGHNHSMNRTSLPEGSGLRAVPEGDVTFYHLDGSMETEAGRAPDARYILKFRRGRGYRPQYTSATTTGAYLDYTGQRNEGEFVLRTFATRGSDAEVGTYDFRLRFTDSRTGEIYVDQALKVNVKPNKPTVTVENLENAAGKRAVVKSTARNSNDSVVEFYLNNTKKATITAVNGTASWTPDEALQAGDRITTRNIARDREYIPATYGGNINVARSTSDMSDVVTIPTPTTPTADKTALNTALSEETTTKASPAYYNAEASKKTAYDQAVTAGKAVLAKDNATQTEVNDAVSAITNAKNALGGVATNKDALRTATSTEDAATKATAAYYNAEASKKTAYDQAVTAGKAVLAKDNATQTEVNDAVSAITNAKNALGGVATNKDALQTATSTGDTETKATAVPSDDTTREPEVVTSNSQPVSSENNVLKQNDSESHATLPNTGTKEDRAAGALGILSLLGAFGLLFAKKKKDDEEEA